MASLEGISLQVSLNNGQRTIISSVGGFSQPNRRSIRSLQQLLETVRSKGLALYEGPSLRSTKFVGQGVSYRVYKCSQRLQGLVVAVKQIKLPRALGNNEAFDRQVATVLRDIEVMTHAPLAQHANIINLLGCGWNFGDSGAIPFLVTEYATDGKMRDYLNHYLPAARDKLLCCIDVAQGLHALHNSGIVHGDLKLDNGIRAKISDFGHSLLIYEDEDEKEEQRYGGTLAYNAPELNDHRKSRSKDVNFRKCDVWALGLLCWETVDNGLPYYGSSPVQELAALSKTASGSSSSPSPSVARASSDDVVESLSLISEQLKHTAIDFLKTSSEGFSNFEKLKLTELFEQTLEANPDQRIFRPMEMSRIQFSVKARIVDDCARLGSENGSSVSSARGAFHVALAYLSGFGVDVNPDKALNWLEKSLQKGLPLARCFGELFKDVFGRKETKAQAPPANLGSISDSQPLFSPLERYSRIVRSGFRDLVKHESSNTYALYPSDLEELRALAKETEEETDFVHCIPHHALFLGWVKQFECFGKLTRQEINMRDASGETALFRASQMGDHDAVGKLLDAGADPNISANDGCTPLHWLFMFEPERMATVIAGIDARSTDPLSDVHFNIDGNCETPRVVDHQLPIQLVGTPLAFSVAAACQPAIEILLRWGANPNPASMEANWVKGRAQRSHRSPMHLAYSLHLVHILEMLEASNGMLPDATNVPQLLAESSPLERTLIHGQESLTAWQRTMQLYISHGGGHSHFERVTSDVMTAWDVGKPMIQIGNLESARMSMEILRPASTIKLRKTLVLDGEARDIMLTCTFTACNGTLSHRARTDILDFAISEGALIEPPSQDLSADLRPMNIAIRLHQADVLDWFLQQRLDLNIQDDSGRTPLHQLLLEGFSSEYSITKLLEKGADPDLQDRTGRPCLRYAIDNRVLEDVKILLHHGARVRVCHDGIEYFSALHAAIKTKNAHMVSLILRHGCDVNGRASYGETALSSAVKEGSPEIVKPLLNAGADHSNLNPQGLTYVHLASLSGEEDILRILLEKGASPDLPCQTIGETPLHFAVRRLEGTALEFGSAFSCCKQLLDAGADPNRESDDKTTPIMSLFTTAIRQSPSKAIQELMKLMVIKGGDLSSINPVNGRSMLHEAVLCNKTELVETLLLLGTSPDSQVDAAGTTLLHICAMSGGKFRARGIRSEDYTSIVQALLSSGASLTSKNSQGKTPVDFAVQYDQGNMLRYLLQAYLKTRRDLIVASRNQARGKSPTRSAEPSYTSSVCEEFESPTEEIWKKSVGLSQTSVSALTNDAADIGGRTALSYRTAPGQAFMPLEDPLLEKAWISAIKQRLWGCLSAFMSVGFEGPMQPFAEDQKLEFLRYALMEELDFVLVRFMGDLHGNLPHPDLEGTWTRLRKCKVRRLTQLLTSTEIHRVKELIAKKTYDPLLGWGTLVGRDYVEVQRDSGIEVFFQPYPSASAIEESVLEFPEADAEAVPPEDQVEENLTSLLDDMAYREYSYALTYQEGDGRQRSVYREAYQRSRQALKHPNVYGRKASQLVRRWRESRQGLGTSAEPPLTVREEFLLPRRSPEINTLPNVYQKILQPYGTPENPAELGSNANLWGMP